jgi:two-component system sensor histidine kinase SenX3
MIAALAVALVAAVVAIALQRRQLSVARADRRQRERMAAVVEERLAAARTDIFRYATALDEVGPGVVLYHEDGREIVRNRSAREFAGARHADVLVQSAVTEEVAAALRGDTRRRTVELVGPPRRMLVIAATPVPAGGAVVVIDDVSERRRVDSVRRDFVANVSHELKTPVGALGILAEAIVDSDDEGVIRRLADRMTTEAIRVGRLIDDLLALARLETDDAPALESVRVASIVGDAVARVRGLAESRRVQVDATGASGEVVVLGDAGQLVAAVSNLLENACVYSEEGGAVAVRSRAVEAWVEIEVEDHGLGIPSSEIDRIFERFYRVDRARSRNTGGTGLGLAIVRHVATNHGGEVLVRSTEGAGSTFTLRLRSAAIALAS